MAESKLSEIPRDDAEDYDGVRVWHYPPNCCDDYNPEYFVIEQLPDSIIITRKQADQLIAALRATIPT